jgi:hypothetical protein
MNNTFAPVVWDLQGSRISQAEAWQITIGLLQSQADAEAKLFAATTLRGKVRRAWAVARFQVGLTFTDHLRCQPNTL